MLSVSTSTRYHHGNLRDVLLAAARAVLEEKGPDALSLREVAREAGVSHNAPYRHFASRDALLAALAARGFIELATALSRGERRERGVAYVRFALANPPLFRLMFGGSLRIEAHPELRQAAAAAFEALRGGFGAAGSATKSASGLPPAPSAAWALVHGLSQLILDGHLHEAAGDDPEDFARRVIGVVQFGDETEPRTGSR